MLTADQAEALIFDLVTPLQPPQDAETIPLAAALGRILAVPVTSVLDFPHWDNSAMDGYAVRHQDVQQVPATLQIVEEIPAGQAPQRKVQAGQAARILTGAMMPDGADTVVMQEETQRQGEQVTILKAPSPQNFVRQQGSYYQAGTTLLPAGQAIAPPEIAVLAAAQCPQVTVFRRPRVAILSTGDELVEPDQPLQPGQIVDSNQYALTALVAQAGAEPLSLGIVPDRPEALKSAIATALDQADWVISSGGVSVGDYDYVDRILSQLGATLHLRAVAVKPGKPLTVASLPKGDRTQLYFGLPGNPVSALVSYWRFVQPALSKLSGRAEGWGPAYVRAETTQLLRAGGQRQTYLWGRLGLTEQGYRFTPAAGGHSSGNLINLAQTTGLAIVPQGQTQIAAGEPVRVMTL